MDQFDKEIAGVYAVTLTFLGLPLLGVYYSAFDRKSVLHFLAGCFASGGMHQGKFEFQTAILAHPAFDLIANSYGKPDRLMKIFGNNVAYWYGLATMEVFLPMAATWNYDETSIQRANKVYRFFGYPWGNDPPSIRRL